MTSNRCLGCGSDNPIQALACEECGRYLPRGEERERELQELRDYHALRRRYNIVGIIIGLLVLLLACPALQLLFVRTAPLLGAGPVPELVAKYAALVVVAITFLAGVVPMLVGRWRTLRRYRWTRERRQELAEAVRRLPDDLLGTPGPDTLAPSAKGPPAILLIAIFGLLAFVILGGQADSGPLTAITSQFGIGQAAKVSGGYSRHYDSQNLGGGVAQADQTWSYVFRDDGGYTTYLNGNEQYSGTWSQSGNQLTIKIDPIPSLGTPGHTAVGTVAADGRSFKVGNEEYTKVE